MKRKHHSSVAEGLSEGVQIIRKLQTAHQLLNQGQSVADVCRVLEVSAPTYYCWQQLCGGMKATEAKRLKELEMENTRLKRLLADAELDRQCSSRRPGTAVGACRGKLSKPGASSQGSGGSAGSIPGFPAACMPVNWSTPQYPAGPCPAGRHRGAEAQTADP